MKINIKYFLEKHEILDIALKSEVALLTMTYMKRNMKTQSYDYHNIGCDSVYPRDPVPQDLSLHVMDVVVGEKLTYVDKMCFLIVVFVQRGFPLTFKAMQAIWPTWVLFEDQSMQLILGLKSLA